MNEQPLTAALSLQRAGAPRVGGDRIRLLEAIARHGTIAGAAREAIERRLRALGFTYVTLDLRGFRSGSLNEPHRGAAGDVRAAGSDPAGSAAVRD